MKLVYVHGMTAHPLQDPKNPDTTGYSAPWWRNVRDHLPPVQDWKHVEVNYTDIISPLLAKLPNSWLVNLIAFRRWMQGGLEDWATPGGLEVVNDLQLYLKNRNAITERIDKAVYPNVYYQGEVEETVLLGHSLGSVAVWDWAHRYHRPIRSLILCGCPITNPWIIGSMNLNRPQGPRRIVNIGVKDDPISKPLGAADEQIRDWPAWIGCTGGLNFACEHASYFSPTNAARLAEQVTK